MFKAMKSSVFATSLIVAGLVFVAPATASTVVVDAFANSTSGGSGADAGLLSLGETFSVSVSPTDIWSAGALPRWSNANGLIADLHATGTDESGQPAATLIGEAFVNWTQGGLTAPFGSLVGSIAGGNFFLVGTSFSGVAPTSGELQLWFFDQNNGDDTDHITANVTTGVGSVPEPSTWAMMILGFAGVGFMGYRRRKGSMMALTAT